MLARHPAIMAIAQSGVREDRQSELQRLVAITDVDGASVHSLNGDIWAATPVHFLNALDRALYNSPAWKMAVQGSLGRLWRNNRYYFLAPVFVNGRVGAVAVSHFSMDEATAQLRLSNHELWITDGSGRVLYSNNEQRSQHSPDTSSVFLPELHAQIWVKPTGPVPFSSWGARAGVASLVTFALTSLITLLLARRRLLAAENQRRRRQNETLEQRVEQRTQELVQAQDALVQSGKLALLGQVTASIAHEINQPLGAIHNYAENSVRLLDAGKQEAAVRNQRKISEQAQRTARIVENLRAFSKKDRQGVQVVNVQDAIQAVLAAVSDRFAPLNKVVDTRWLVNVEALAGRVRFEQILMNLIINAWKEIEACEDQQIWIGSDTVSDNALAIWVEDSGRGIEGLTEQELFEPLLPHAHKSMDWDWALPLLSNSLRPWAAICVWPNPSTCLAHVLKSNCSRTRLPIERNSMSEILLVDDDEAFRDSLAQSLALEGFQVREFSQGHSVLPYIKPLAEVIVVSDIRMPKLSGEQLRERVHDLDAEVPLLLMTGHGDVPMAVGNLRAGAFAFFSKPLNLPEVVEDCRRALHVRQAVVEKRKLAMERGGAIGL